MAQLSKTRLFPVARRERVKYIMVKIFCIIHNFPKLSLWVANIVRTMPKRALVHLRKLVCLSFCTSCVVCFHVVFPVGGSCLSQM